MRFIHVSDLHLGRTLRERPLCDEQAAMLEAIALAACDPSIAALVIAGDIYDRGVPPPDAVALLDGFLAGLRAARPDLAIIAIPGNHDSAARLSFGARFFEGAGVHIRTDALSCVVPVVVERGGERAAFWTLPFLTPGCLPPDFGGKRADGKAGTALGELDFGEEPPERLRSQEDLCVAALSAIAPRLLPGAANILVAHLFARGGLASESERAFVGTAEQVDSGLFDAFDYAALGHLHRPQAAGGKGRYSGAPLAYSFDESGQERGFLVVDVDPGAPATMDFVPIRPKRALRRIIGTWDRIMSAAALDANPDDYIEAVIEDPAPVLNPVERLRERLPNLLSVRQAAFESVAGAHDAAPVRIERADAAGVLGDFSAFHKEVLGKEADADTLALMAGLVEEAEHAARQA
ncbi:MAG TPA: exonuclease SbcCD subunit D [Spirochaetales bacterium]|nr:exonuclease SbcCD subunit D [Spirochaetales bacterium]